MNNKSTIEPVRDEWLGELLRELEVPQHGPEFQGEFRRRVHEERRASRRRGTTRWLVRVAVVAAVAAVAIAVVGLPRGGESPLPGGPQAASAALVKARVRAALTTLRSLSGTLIATGPHENDGGRWRFALDAAGDLRLEGPKPGDVETYDARTGAVRSAQHSASLGGDTLFYAERTGVAPGPPDQGPPSWVLPEQYGAFVRAALADTPSSVAQTTYDGRAAWQLEADTTPNAIVPDLSGDHLAITVDRGTGMPVRIVESKHGAILRELRIESLAINANLPAHTFSLAFPAGAVVMRSDDGFRRVSLDRVAAAIGYRPLVPTWVPDGYRLAEVAIARDAGATGKEGGNPPSRMVVSLSYRRGLDQFLVTTRLRGDGTWNDPLGSPEGYSDTPTTTPLTAGTLAGTDAEVVVSAQTEPHLWATSDSLVITVGGDLDRQDLTRVAGSLGRR
jgi:hypothetical protein